ncbi:Hypothetical protein LEPBI_I0415 [Leptospira biflexa serovar Patoc strain 'Patoc 1 (Paris)']|uniref:Uncharacterized protein n=1 Tax=Leptospira biflexa serovar Patoc (strain Patoc 1 / ATCC 23582 / Paris) TaxID=456481 RepID=B0SIW4_LEPBP|nr:Hypothetical protein LEPBI_I0415 [Leptospira biflexa serovar Patoc strain 'Patoc 1 (Paris)']
MSLGLVDWGRGSILKHTRNKTNSHQEKPVANKIAFDRFLC